MTLLYIKYRSFVSCCCRKDFFMSFHYKSMVDALGMACMDPRATVGSISKGEYYTLVHTKYESSGPYGFGEDFFLCFSNCKSKGAIDLPPTPPPPRGGAISDHRGMLGSMYVKLHITML